MPSLFDSFSESTNLEFIESRHHERGAPRRCSLNFGVSYMRADIVHNNNRNEFLSYYESEGITSLHPSDYDNLQDFDTRNHSYVSNLSGQLGPGAVANSLRVVYGPTSAGYEALVAHGRHYVLRTRYEFDVTGPTVSTAKVVCYICDGTFGMGSNIPSLAAHPEMRVLVDRGDGVASFVRLDDDRTGLGQEFRNQKLYDFGASPGIYERTLIIPPPSDFCNYAIFVAAAPASITTFGDTFNSKFQFEVRRHPGIVLPDFIVSTSPTQSVPVTFTSVGPNTNSRIGNCSEFKNLINYAWTFGDGQSAAGPALSVVQHTYAAAGTYSVTLTFTDNNGYVGTKTREIVVV